VKASCRARPAKVYALRRDEAGKIVGRDAVIESVA
jgi:hypothetical protein